MVGKGPAQNSNMADVEIVYAGFLVKQGKVIKNWKNRWFELGADQRLKYYRQSPGNKPSVAGTEAGIINLRFCNKILKPDETNVKKWPSEDLSTCFALVLPHRTYYLCAAHANEANDWQTYIDLYCKQNDGDEMDGDVDEATVSESDDDEDDKSDTFSSLSTNLMADANVTVKRSKSVIRGRLDTITASEFARESLDITRVAAGTATQAPL